LRLIDSCITQLKAQGPARTCNESKEEEKKDLGDVADVDAVNEDGPARHVVQPEQQPPDRALAAT